MRPKRLDINPRNSLHLHLFLEEGRELLPKITRNPGYKNVFHMGSPFLNSNMSRSNPSAGSKQYSSRLLRRVAALRDLHRDRTRGSLRGTENIDISYWLPFLKPSRGYGWSWMLLPHRDFRRRSPSIQCGHP